jgi:hypothetical protein
MRLTAETDAPHMLADEAGLWYDRRKDLELRTMLMVATTYGIRAALRLLSLPSVDVNHRCGGCMRDEAGCCIIRANFSVSGGRPQTSRMLGTILLNRVAESHILPRLQPDMEGR